MATAFLSLLGIFVSSYLYLYKVGKIGTIACGTGGCETVQLSPWSRFLGIEVALYGVAGYAVLLAVSLAGVHPAHQGRRWPDDLLFAMSAMGVGFTAYLTYLELFVIHAICRWCVVSAVLMCAIFALSLLSRRRSRSVARVELQSSAHTA